ncbi:MAG TPA: type VI secretion system tip protein TssI/VgrG, partial [Chloroflexota bacterium]|nr:type VI secretion system tip protein TssI/VgrG [Chloroflexota bacterium]
MTATQEAQYTQQGVYLSVATPLGADTLLLRALHGEERLSGLFRFQLEMAAQSADLSFEDLVGQSATVSFALGGGQTRYLNGIIRRFYQAGTDERFTTYHAELVPSLWRLGLTTDSRIFQGKTVPEIVEEIFSDQGLTDYRLELTKTYDSREFCVQYQETALAFVTRLLEDEGIWFFFQHEDGKHTLVLADDASAHPACPGLPAEVLYQSAVPGETSTDAVAYCTYEQQVAVGKYVVDDFNFETPSNDLVQEQEAEGGDANASLYEYPAGYTQTAAGEQRAGTRLESHRWARTLLRGEGRSPAFSAGHSFQLTGHERAAANTQWVLHRVTHQATVNRYGNRFEAFLGTVPFRPPRRTPRPRIAGTQTALVVGKQGEEIWTDQYGRITVQFHWDREGQLDENSSCWVRVAQGWAGQNWGSQFIPRVGQEVVVTFLEGDPDRPLITGAVYNAVQTVPYALPDESTKSTIKSNSSKGGGGSNELRFEDKKGEEEVYLHAQKDLQVQVLNDEIRTVTQNRTTTIEEGNDTLTVSQGNRTVTVSTGNETHEVQG